MKTVQMTLDEKLVTTVDKVVKTLGTTRSAFARDALRMALKHYKTRALEEKHRKGYRKKPANPGEFSVWEDEHAWGD
jgi:metal-responsive CopG/Arc/MetJ family transcriptional regulator